MPGTYQRMRSRGAKGHSRSLLVGAFFVSFVALLCYDGWKFFPTVNAHLLLVAWLDFACSALIALAYVGVGALVWFYARERVVAVLVFCFCVLMTLLFALATFDIQQSGGLAAFIESIDSPSAMALLVILLLYFPTNYFRLVFPGKQAPPAGARGFRHRLVRGVLATYLGLSLVLLGADFLRAWWKDLAEAGPYLPHGSSLAPAGGLLDSLSWMNSFVLSIGIIVTVIVSYRVSSPRQRMQLRLFTLGVLLALVPVLLLVIVPQFLNFPPQLTLDPIMSSLSMMLLPPALGYMVLRNQILLLDCTIRRVVTLTIGVLGLAVFGYLDVACCIVFLPGQLAPLCVTVVMGGMLPLVWWGSRRVAGWLFSPETVAVLRLLYEQDAPDSLVSDPYDLAGVGATIERTAAHALGTEKVCLLVLDEERGSFLPVTPPTSALSPGLPEEQRRDMVCRVLASLDLASLTQSTTWIEASPLLLDRLEGVWPALSVGEMGPLAPGRLGGWGRLRLGLKSFLTRSATAGGDATLLVPLRVQGEVIGLLILGERETLGPYAGPDFEAIGQLLLRFSGVLQTARLFRHVQRTNDVLTAFCRTSADERARPLQGQGVEGVWATAIAAADALERALSVDAEFWLCDGGERRLRPQLRAGAPSRLTRLEALQVAHPSDSSAWFLAGDRQNEGAGGQVAVEGPACLPLRPPPPLAWLPLRGKSQFLGVLVLLYRGPHHFSSDEQRLLERFAEHCAVSLEMARLRCDTGQRAAQLRAAMQEHHDLLQQQATRALHEPLARLQEYLDLFRKAQRGGDVAPLANHHGEEGDPPVSCPPPFLPHVRVVQALLRTVRALVFVPAPSPGESLVNPMVDRSIAAILTRAEHGLRPVVVAACEPMAGLLTSALRVEGYEPVVLPSLEEARAWLGEAARADEPLPVAIVLDVASFRLERGELSVERTFLHALQEVRVWQEPPPLLALAREGPDWRLRITSGQGEVMAQESSVTPSALLKRVQACLQNY